VRHPAHLASIERELRCEIGERPQVMFLRADICRRELLVEIEAVGTMVAG
jgi:chorismate lyase/3-hydroxybenzoate synthase